jgi:hypothetical protein
MLSITSAFSCYIIVPIANLSFPAQLGGRSKSFKAALTERAIGLNLKEEDARRL